MKHIPNILSASRILMIPFFVAFMLRDNLFAAAILLVVSGLTDLLDGLLARRFGWISDLGKVLDPAADKLTQIAVCVVLVVKLRQYWPIFAIMLAKEAVMLVLGGYLFTKGVRIEGAKWFGKVATFVFYGVMAAILFFPSIPGLVKLGLLILVALLSIIAGLLYIPQYFRYRRGIKNRRRQPAANAGKGASHVR